MRGQDEQQLDVYSYVSPAQRVPQDHPLRPLRVMTDEALRELQPWFNKLYAKTGRPSIAPEKLLRALLLQALYSVRSERLLMEQLDYNLLFRWFVGLNMDDAIWDVTVCSAKHQPSEVTMRTGPHCPTKGVRDAHTAHWSRKTVKSETNKSVEFRTEK
jgi:transposase